jgi:hypothetical protein
MTLQTIDPDANYYVDQVAKLKAALRWVLTEGASVASSKDQPLRLYDNGCGCCSHEVRPPEDVRAAIVGVLSED